SFFLRKSRSEKLCADAAAGLSDKGLNRPAGAGTLPGMAHEHPHGHTHDHSELDDTELRVRALQTILTQKGYVDTAALDRIVETYQTRIGPRNGARVVARAWSD